MGGKFKFQVKNYFGMILGLYCDDFGTVNSWFKKVHVFFLKSRVVRFKKDLCSESKINYVGEFAA